jgi:hypothetical protein
MKSHFHSSQFSDKDGCPEGGQTWGQGFAIAWQRGPLGRGAEREGPNGAFVEDVIAAALERLQFYQESRFNCEENARAILHLQSALDILNSRAARREQQNTEGTLQGK